MKQTPRIACNYEVSEKPFHWTLILQRFIQISKFHNFPHLTGAGEEARTLDINLGKVALYQLSYARKNLYYKNLGAGEEF